MKKRINVLAKVSVMAICIMLALVFISTVSVKAESNDTVRVSTAKELTAAIQDKDVEVIYLRTDAYIDIIINADKAAAGKYLYIYAPNVNITNKAVFARIDINEVNSFTEEVSGNNFYLPDYTYNKGIIVAENITVNSIILDGSDFKKSKYTLRKGAKVNEVELHYYGAGFPTSRYNKTKNLVTLKAVNKSGNKESYTVKLDKSGRIKKITCTTDDKDTAFEYTFKYDENGNVIKYKGFDSEKGKFTTKNTYSDGLLKKSVTTAEELTETIINDYNEEGRLSRNETTTVYPGSSTYVSYVEYEYDKNGRCIAEKYSDPAGDDITVFKRTYNSKGFNTKSECVEYNGLTGYNPVTTSIVKNKYSKAGDLIKHVTYDVGGEVTRTLEVTYDELGNYVDSNEIFY